MAILSCSQMPHVLLTRQRRVHAALTLSQLPALFRIAQLLLHQACGEHCKDSWALSRSIRDPTSTLLLSHTGNASPNDDLVTILTASSGHYGPIFNAYLEAQNALILKGKLWGAKYINLKTLLIGNGWFDPLIHYQAFYNFTVSPGNTYDYKPFNEQQQTEIYNALYAPGGCVEQTQNCYKTGDNDICGKADGFCAFFVEYELGRYANRDEYDFRELTPDPFPYNFYSDYLNTPKVQQAIGSFVNYSDYSGTVGSSFGTTGDDDREDGTVEAVRALVKQGVYVVQYTGDADYNCNW